MLCQKCREREAETSVKQIINGKGYTLYLCNECAYGVESDDYNNYQSSENLDINSYMSERAKKVVQYAVSAAMSHKNRTVDTQHLLLGILEDDEVISKILKKLDINKEELRLYVEKQIVDGISDQEVTDLTPRAKQVMQLAFSDALELGHKYIGPEHILLGLIKEGEGLAYQIFKKYGVSYTQVRQVVVNIIGEGDETGKKALEESETPTLDKYSRDLTLLAKQGKIDPVIGRSDEITRVIQILSRRRKNNPVLLGEPGVGKTAIAEGLAYRIANGTAPEVLLNKKVKELDISGLLAGSKFRGEFEERAQKVIKELEKAGGNIILFIDELHTIVGTGAQEGQMDLSNMLKPALARGEVQVIGATTISEYKKYIEKDAALERRFQPVLVDEPTVQQTIEILKGIRDKYEAHHKVKITDDAITSSAVLSERYIKDRFLPDKAIDVLDEACSRVKLEQTVPPVELRELLDKISQMEKERESLTRSGDYQNAAKMKQDIEKLKQDMIPLQEQWNKKKGTGIVEVRATDIADIVSKMTGVPVSELKQEEKEKLTKLEEELHKRVVGQEYAVKAVSEAVRRSRVGLKDPNRPVASFIFLGPTGVGKTELAKALAEYVFGDENSIIRIDMTEYMEKHAVSKLIGSPPGYVGFEEGGQLTEKIRRQPYSLILLDELEKAHPDVFNILLQILDDGRLTDSKGRTVDFKNCIIIATSNIGSSLILDHINKEGDKDWKSLEDKIMNLLKETIRPELLNRFDDIIIFHSLNKEHIKEIVKLLLSSLSNLVEAQDMKISYQDDVIEYLATKGYDPEFGARPLKRLIQKEIENPLSMSLLDGKFVKGDKIIVKLTDGKLEFIKGTQ